MCCCLTGSAWLCLDVSPNHVPEAVRHWKLSLRKNTLCCTDVSISSLAFLVPGSVVYLKVFGGGCHIQTSFLSASRKQAGAALFDQHDNACARAVDYVFLAACDGGAILLLRPRKLAVGDSVGGRPTRFIWDTP